MIDFSLNEGVLIMADKVIELPCPVIQALDFQRLIIVRVDPAFGEIYNRNIFALDANGEVKWQIAESPHGTEDDKPYTSLGINDGTELIVGNWNGVGYTVSLGDGSITVNSFNK